MTAQSGQLSCRAGSPSAQLSPHLVQETPATGRTHLVGRRWVMSHFTSRYCNDFGMRRSPYSGFLNIFQDAYTTSREQRRRYAPGSGRTSEAACPDPPFALYSSYMTAALPH